MSRTRIPRRPRPPPQRPQADFSCPLCKGSQFEINRREAHLTCTNCGCTEPYIDPDNCMYYAEAECTTLCGADRSLEYEIAAEIRHWSDIPGSWVRRNDSEQKIAVEEALRLKYASLTERCVSALVTDARKLVDLDVSRTECARGESSSSPHQCLRPNRLCVVAAGNRSRRDTRFGATDATGESVSEVMYKICVVPCHVNRSKKKSLIGKRYVLRFDRGRGGGKQPACHAAGTRRRAGATERPCGSGACRSARRGRRRSADSGGERDVEMINHLKETLRAYGR